MDYKLFELKFNTGIHLGSGMLNDSVYTIKADTLFSALCIEAVKLGKLEELLGHVKENGLLFSDSLPYIKESDTNTEYLVPKPMLYIEPREQGNAVIKKKMKNLKFIPVNYLSEYLSGNFQNLALGEQKIASFEGLTKAKIARGGEDAEPYHVGVYYFSAHSGLYFIVGYGDESILGLIQQLFAMLSLEGLGGKRSVGLGKFHYRVLDVPNALKKRLQDQKDYTVMMSLSLSYPREEELDRVLDGASYLLEKRSGFIYSDSYSEEYSRKQDGYFFSAGSCFKNSFRGDIYDVATDTDKHPVYRYGKPLLMGVMK